MRKIFSILLIVSVMMYAQDTLTILHVNDTHSVLAPLAPRTSDLKGTVGGIARVATVIGQTKMTEQNVLTLHGGDVFIGDLFFNQYFGVAEFQLMNAIGFDVMALGNHEFDLMPSTLLTAFDSSLGGGGFSVVSSNLNLEDPAVQALKKYVKQYTIKQFGDIKGGIFSLLTPATNYFSQPSPAVVEEDVSATITNMLTSLLGEGCNFIICISHLGINYDKAIAAATSGINVIISAHDHLLTEKPLEIPNPMGYNTLIVQAGAFYSHVGKLKLIFKEGSVQSFEYNLIALDENIPEEPTIAGVVNSLVNSIESTFGSMYSQQVGFATEDFDEVADSIMIKRGNFSTAVGNLITDAYRAKTKTDLGITVGGSSAQPLYHGPIVAADIYRMISYGFNEVNTLGYRLTKFKIKGIDLWKAIESCLSQTISDDELLPQVSGMDYNFVITNPVGQRVKWILINGNPIDTAAIYSVTSNEFLSYALQNVFNIPISDLYTYPDTAEFHVVLEYILAQGGMISPKHESRVTTVENKYVAIPDKYELCQNYPNPFNPTTNFEFQIVERGLVSLKVYDILGNEVATIINRELPAGNYKYQWNASGLASGVYIYRLQAGSFIDTKKLILMK
jgi:5'-nucleotidase / UDP-sugar diphosphatase